MVKPNVSYVKETNEVHYNPRFAIKFEEGNYVEEANYLKEIHTYVLNKMKEINPDTDNYLRFYVDGYVKTWVKGTEYDISNEPFYKYIKLICLNRIKLNYSDEYLWIDSGYARVTNNCVELELSTGICACLPN